MAKTNYQFERRQRDLAKKKKQEEKRQRKLAAKLPAEGDPGASPEQTAPEQPAPQVSDSTTPKSGEN